MKTNCLRSLGVMAILLGLNLTFVCTEAAGQDRPYLAVQLTGDSEQAEIERVLAGGPADQAGVKVGDVIVGFDGTKVSSLEDLRENLGQAQPDQVIKLDLERDGEIISLDVKLGKYDPIKQQQGGIEGEQAPPWKIDNWDGLPDDKQSLDIGDLNGKVVYVYCFQSWCPGCHSHGFPTLKEVQEKFAGAEDVQFVAVQTVFEGFDTNTPERGKEVVRDKFGLDIPLGYDGSEDSPSSLMSDYHARGTPWTIIIDKKGIVRANGFEIDADDAIELVEELREEN